MLSKSTTGRDRGVTFDDYAPHGVCEYRIIGPVRKPVEQYQLDEPTMAFAGVAVLYRDDTLSAGLVPAFQIPVQAIFDKGMNMDVLQSFVTKPA